MIERLPQWLQNWLHELLPLVLTILVLLAAWLLKRILRRVIDEAGRRYQMPAAMVMAPKRLGGFVINVAALLLILQLLGVSGTVLWTAFTGFAAVGAVAFFAAWSVLSNLFCTLLIITTRPFRLHDRVELLENGEKPGLKGEVIDINMVYTTLREDGEAGTTLRVPNNLFFQRTIRRWPPGTAPAPEPTIQ
ncbi:mechanosensitive ion channel family protein [Pseudofulvimonas gallinarii]|jgi:small-conductance mechanosensitive channel|uniref:Small-conductance mechanosensitive channel n=1 Tax=Pseudofulvimonas gallinarii TaxID=634155 RepID=A0A4S3KY21_9GAMM|nr:mechanosensitive ion channel family protein [Pseudofulvimonas gallinarii]TCT00041.1 mechanosensitive ion channel-like protein [Pseudofulvimonas gallinarii]THD13518.1 mechanosensitive ion channel protein MscS [Pseudofulvimonas gallinarii]